MKINYRKYYNIITIANGIYINILDRRVFYDSRVGTLQEKKNILQYSRNNIALHVGSRIIIHF